MRTIFTMPFWISELPRLLRTLEALHQPPPPSASALSFLSASGQASAMPSNSSVMFCSTVSFVPWGVAVQVVLSGRGQGADGLAAGVFRAVDDVAEPRCRTAGSWRSPTSRPRRWERGSGFARLSATSLRRTGLRRRRRSTAQRSRVRSSARLAARSIPPCPSRRSAARIRRRRSDSRCSPWGPACRSSPRPVRSGLRRCACGPPGPGWR